LRFLGGPQAGKDVRVIAVRIPIRVLGVLAASAMSAAALAQPAASPSPPAKDIGLLAATLSISDLDRSVSFYTKGLGLTAPTRLDNPASVEVPLLFPAGGPSLLLIKAKGPGPAAGGPPRIGRVVINVADIAALQARLEAAGYHLAEPITENPTRHVSVALVEDPDGNELELVQRPH
jgi:catechol 2,3-dioxygenase-like lactoylglutathione lyase family enzyme